MADEHGHGAQAQEAQPAKATKSKLEIITDEWTKNVANPAAAAGISGIGHAFLGFPVSIPSLAFPLGYSIEQFVKKDGKPEFKTERLPAEAAIGAVSGAGIYFGSQMAGNMSRSLGLERIAAGTFGSLGNIGAGAATFGLLTFGLPLLVYPLSHVLSGKTSGIWNNLKSNYFKNIGLKSVMNGIASLAVMDSYSGYAWTNYLTTTSAAYLTSLLAPYIAVPPVAMLALGIGALAVGYRLAFSRENISYGKLLTSPFVGAYNLGIGAAKTAVNGAIGLVNWGIKIVNDAYTAMLDLGVSTHNAMMGAVPAPAAKKGGH